jgi:hypothetical protein
MHRELGRETRVKSLFAAMVDVARAQRSTRRRLNATELRTLIKEGAAAGERAAGPVGAIVGGAVGAATGTVGGILGVEERPRFREYVIREHRPSFRYREDVRIWAVLPERGVTLYAVPREYHVRPGYRYAIVNDRPVIVEPRSRRIVEIIE